MELEFIFAQNNYSLSVQQKNKQYQIQIGDEILNLHVEYVTPNCMMLTDKNHMQRIYIASTIDKTFIHLNGYQYMVEHPIEKEKTSYENSHLFGAESGICAPMPGKILKILVKENQTVEEKQNLVIVEAMKMEHNIRAPHHGIIKKINFKESDLVDTGQEILEVELINKTE